METPNADTKVSVQESCRAFVEAAEAAQNAPALEEPDPGVVQRRDMHPAPAKEQITHQ